MLKKIKLGSLVGILMAFGVVAMIAGVAIGDYATHKAAWVFGDILAWSGVVAFLGGIGLLAKGNREADQAAVKDIESKK